MRNYEIYCTTLNLSINNQLIDKINNDPELKNSFETVRHSFCDEALAGPSFCLMIFPSKALKDQFDALVMEYDQE